MMMMCFYVASGSSSNVELDRATVLKNSNGKKISQCQRSLGAQSRKADAQITY